MALAQTQTSQASGYPEAPSATDRTNPITMRHIIIEGPDGAGKDTLIYLLQDELGLALHPRASTSMGGPVDNVAQWTAHDVNTMEVQPRSIYNRHPLISERIYAKYRTVKPGLQQPEWSYPAWVGALTRHAAKHCVLVLCMPPLSIVERIIKTQGANAHMPGVADNIRAIYGEYYKVVWPGTVFRYDWTRAAGLQNLTTKLKRVLDV